MVGRNTTFYELTNQRIEHYRRFARTCGFVFEFDTWLWLTTVEIITVKNDGSLVFKFYYGFEIKG